MGTTVLVVDDSNLARIFTCRALAALQPDWLRVEAASANEALQAIDVREVNLAIIDYNMPGRDGLALAEELRIRFPDMPIAIATANVQEDMIARAQVANATFIPKPLTKDGLRNFISVAALTVSS